MVQRRRPVIWSTRHTHVSLTAALPPQTRSLRRGLLFDPLCLRGPSGDWKPWSRFVWTEEQRKADTSGEQFPRFFGLFPHEVPAAGTASIRAFPPKEPLEERLGTSHGA